MAPAADPGCKVTAVTAKPLFLAGLGRSGTTVLAEAFGAHPRIVMGVERFKKLWPSAGIRMEHFEKESFFNFDDGMTNITPAADVRWARHYADQEAKWDDAEYVGDKVTRIMMKRMWVGIPDARFVTIVRDIESVAHSWQARASNENDKGWPARADARASVDEWNIGLQRIRIGIAERPDHVRVVEYSSFFGDPAATSFKRVLDWLGLDWGPEVEARFEEIHGKFARSISKKPRELSAETQEFIAKRADRDLYESLKTRAL